MDCSKDSIKCTYVAGKSTLAENPHVQKPQQQKKIYDDILDAVGNTPMVRLNKIPQSFGLKCEVLVKCEFLNIGGSVKDRIGVRMVLDAEKQGRITPGKTTLVEATSGNTGVGLAIAAAVRGYKLIITMPEKMSTEKQNVLNGLGAQVIRTPTEAPMQSDESLFGVAKRLISEIPDSVILDQYSNPSNPMAHYEGTAEEIIQQCDGRVTAIVIAAGTGGTITGIARKILEKLPDCKIIAVDPMGSTLALPGDLNVTDVTSYKIEGIGYDFVPRVLDRTEVHEWIKTEDAEGLLMARRLVQEEGLLCGGSSGTAVVGGIRWALKAGLTEKDRIVIVLPDNIRNYLTKHLSKEWMIENQFISYDELKEPNHPLNSKPLTDLNLPVVESLLPDATIGECLAYFKNYDSTKSPALPIINNKEDKKIVAVIFQQKLMQAVLNKKLQKTDLVTKAQTKDFVQVPNTLDQAQLERLLERNQVIFVLNPNESASTVQWVTPAHILQHLDA